MANEASNDQSPGELIGRLSNDLQSLIHQELELATRELTQKLDDAKQQAGTLSVGVAALAGGGLVLLAAGVLALSLVLPAWAAALAVGTVVMVSGAVLVASGKSKLEHLNLRPERAMASLKGDVAAIKGAAS
ncbi:MAG TPA: phage holin family protein [Polyangiaceae bacterium]|nr:phage holin family protein [Polyangiaceae bacterium]